MKISAVTEGANLEISFEETVTPGTIAVDAPTDALAGDGTALLKPVHYVLPTEFVGNGSGKYEASTGTGAVTAAKQWAHAFSKDYDEVFTTDTYKDSKAVDAIGTLGTVPSKTDWALIVPIWIQLNDQSKIQAENITVTAAITQADADTASKGMETAGRVVILKTDKSVYNDEVLEDGDTSSALFSITQAGTAGKKLVYAAIYFDGDDDSCKSSLFDTDNYTVNLTFTADISAAKAVE